MTWGVVGGAAISVVGGALSGRNAAKKAKEAEARSLAEQQRMAQQQRQWQLEDFNRARDTNKQITGENWQRQQEALDMNRIDQTSDFGGVTYDEQGNQVSSLAPELQAKLGGLRDQYDTNIEQLGQGFDENSPVYQALRAQQLRGRGETRDRENARLAAQGLSTGSGQAWQGAQEAQNLADVQAEESAWLGGLNAWNTTQGAARANLGALAGTETAWNQNAQRQPDFAKIAAPNQSEMNPSGTVSPGNWGTANTAGANAGASYANQGNAMWGGIGDIATAGINAYNRRPPGNSATGGTSGFDW